MNRLYKKERRNYFNNLQKNDLEDIKSFWKTVKPLISDKCRSSNNIKITKDQGALNKYYKYTRGSVARVANSYHDKNSRHDKKLVFKFGKYIYHRYIYISRPPCERNRQTDVQIVN